MSDMKKLFYPFERSDQKAFWSGYTSPRMHFFNNNSIIPDVAFGEEFLISTRELTLDTPHIHDGAINFFLFLGSDLTDIFNTGIDVDFCIGDTAESMEIYHITKPTAVVVPPGVFHAPLYYKKVGHGALTLLHYIGTTVGRVYPRTNAEGKEEWFYQKPKPRYCVEDPSKLCSICGKCFTKADETPEDVRKYMEPFYKNASTAGKYKDCFVELKEEYHKLGDAVISPRLVFRGKETIAGADELFSFNIVTKPCTLGDEEPMSNGQVAEFLWFSGADAYDGWASFDAEIEVELGESPDKMETVTINEPGVIALKPGTWRGAIRVKRVGKPLCFIPFYVHDKPRYKLTQKIVDGKKLLVYDDASTITEPTAGDELFLQIKR